MKAYIYNWALVLFVIILFANIFYVSPYQEPFIPKNIKSAYRPIHRNIRTNYEGFYNKHKTRVSNIFRKLGIL